MQTIHPVEASVASPAPGRRLKSRSMPMTWQRLMHSTARQDWAPGVFYLVLDIVLWLVVCNLAGFLRNGTVYLGAPDLEVQFLALSVVLITFFVIGGYDRRVDMCSLNHTSEHLIAMVSAAALASLLIYSVAAFNRDMRPSRGALLVSFALFAPGSLLYRRSLSRVLTSDTARHVFLVLGAGDVAQRFFSAYQRSPNREQLRFVDVQGGGAVGRSIAGAGSPVIEGDPAARLDDLGINNRGVILADDIQKLNPTVLERLVRMHFQKTPVYTLESFYETHWRRIPIYDLHSTWPLQMGFQLRRGSPYYQVKRIVDIIASGVALLFISPLLGLIALLTWLDSGSPVLFQQTRVGRSETSFTLFKFRTMFVQPASVAGQSPSSASLYTTPNDERITRLGRWLRKLRLDELPQL